MLLTMMATTGEMWGQEATLSFTSNSWGLPEGSNAGIQGPASYISGNDTITLYASTKFYYNTSDKYLLFGKTNSTLTLPKFSFDVEKIEVVGRNGASGSVKQNIYVGNNAVSTETTGATGTNTYMISSNYQTAGNVYVLKVTSNHNTQVTSIKIYKKQETSVATPTFSPEGGTYTEAQTVTISCDTQNVDIYYTTDGSTPDDESTQYNGSITVSESMTIKAIAYDSDDNASSVATAVYTIQQPLSTMDEIFATATAAGNTATTVIINFDNWVVTGVKNKNAYVTDGTKGFIIYQDGHGFSVGDVLSGTATCKVQLYNGSSEITTLTATTTGLTVTSGGAVTPATNISIADLTGVNTGAVLSYDNLTYNGTALVDANDNTITPYNTLYSYTFVNGKSYNVKGIYLQYNTTKELLPRSADDIEVINTEVADPVFSPEAGTYATTQTVTMSCTTEGAAIHYTTDGTEPDGNSDVYTTGISVSETTTFKAKAIKGDNASAVITATYHICSAESPYTVAQASSYTPATGTSSNVYIHGIVSAFYNTSIVGDGNNYRYYISDDGTTTNQILVYKGKGLNETTFTNADDLLVGDIVTIYGGLTTYSNAPEIVSGNYLVAWERPVEPSITVANATVNVGAEGGEGTLTVTYENITTVVADVWFCNAAGTEEATYDWITVGINNSTNNAEYLVEPNNGAARTAYFKVWAYADDATTEVYSNLVTVTQTEYVAPTPSIAVNPTLVEASAAGADGTIAVTLTAIYNNEIEVQWFESDGTTAATYNHDWIEADVNPNNDIAYVIGENTGDARSAYFKVYGMDSETNDVYSELVTINQAAGTTPPTPGQYDWVATTLANLTSNDVFVIVGDNGDTYAMSNDNGSSAPTAEAVTIENGAITGTVADNIQWNLSTSDDGYMFYPNGTTETWLYCTNTNNGVKVGTGDAKHFTLSDNGYITTSETTNQRYIGIYSSQDWRCYTSNTGTSNIAGQTFAFYKRQVASTDPQLSANDVNIACDATAGEITYTLENAVQGGQLSAEITAGNEGNWLTLGQVGDNVPFTCEANTEATARTATVTLTYTYNETSISATAVVTQAAIIIDYATMPFAFDGGRADIENVNGLTQEGLDSDYGSSPKLKFNTTGDWVVLKLNAKPVSIIYDIKGNSFSNGTFSVQVSEDGVVYDDLEVYDELGDVQTDTIINTNDDVRYIKWIYTTKSSGNVALGNIQVYDVEFTIINSSTTIPDLTIGDGEAIVVNTDVVLELTGTVTNTDPANLIIREGGQLKTENDVQATLQKEVAAYTAKSGDGWYLIASPVEPLATSVVAHGTYDLFTYNEEHAYWYSNTGTTAPFTELHRGQGYLYANASDVDLNYAGTMKATNSNINVNLSYTESLSTNVRGFNLVGNPFTRNIKLGDMELNGATLTQFYVMNAARTGLQSIDNASYEIKPGEGFFVQATDENQQLTFNPTSKGLEDIKFIKIVAGNGNSTDNAYINLSCGNTLRKMNIANLTSVYVMDGDDDYAAARIEDLAGTMPIHFEAVADGEYTITIEAKYTDAHYMHLLDNFTGADIDLLVEPSYTFNATTNDNADRFRLVFDCNNYTGVEENYTSEIFAYQNGSDIYVNGNGELKIFDVMGRMVATQHINGVEAVNVKLQGVYIFRLNGNTQKIVVR